MNERINQFYEQCNQVVDDPFGGAHISFDHRMFAELIVRECARAVDKVYEDAEPDHGCYDWATWAEGADVLKHFGVEE